MIYDIASALTSPSLTLNANEPNGIWSLTWRPDGKLVAGVGKSGTGYVWDPRASKEAIMSKVLPLQALKPVMSSSLRFPKHGIGSILY